MGKYEKLYPIGGEEEKIYEEFIKHAHKLWEEWTGASTFNFLLSFFIYLKPIINIINTLL